MNLLLWCVVLNTKKCIVFLSQPQLLSAPPETVQICRSDCEEISTQLCRREFDLAAEFHLVRFAMRTFLYISRV